MKRIQIVFLAGIIGATILSGCTTESKTYSIIGTKRSETKIQVSAKVPKGASDAEMLTWAKDIEKRDGSRPGITVVFYDGDPRAENVGIYRNGHLGDPPGGTFHRVPK